MRTPLAMVMCLALAMIGSLSTPALAQQKTVAACRAEWQANRATNQANGVTEKAYVAQCRGGTTAAAPTAPLATAPTATTGGQKTVAACRAEWQASKAANQANGVTLRAYVAQCRGGTTAAAPTSPAATAPAPAATTGGQKTVRECRAEWQANKAANQSAGVTEKAYVAQCRAGTAPTTTTAAPPSPVQQTSAPARRPAPTTTATGTPTGANEFTTEAQAKGRCPSDTVVWVNTQTRIYHFSGYKNYGATKTGAYMCERDATAQGFRASKTEKHPGA
jgi:hypothetical protein